MKVVAPPIKSQGIKTKIIPFIKNIIPKNFNGIWIEPFLGTGSVVFNIIPKEAILCDINPHIINFYQEIANGYITAEYVKEYLEKEGKNLMEKGECHYYYIRERFNKYGDPLDFLFLNRSGFNGMIRFNKKGEFNIPFCKKPNRFSKAYITKITNQIKYVETIISKNNYTFICQDYKKTINIADSKDIIYCDPPYIDRHTDYYNKWNKYDELKLHELLSKKNIKFILSTWYSNKYRENKYIYILWKGYNIKKIEHYYHVGASISNRNKVIEALVYNYEL